MKNHLAGKKKNTFLWKRSKYPDLLFHGWDKVTGEKLRNRGWKTAIRLDWFEFLASITFSFNFFRFLSQFYFSSDLIQITNLWHNIQNSSLTRSSSRNFPPWITFSPCTRSNIYRIYLVERTISWRISRRVRRFQ